jgi:hypothetical protein
MATDQHAVVRVLLDRHGQTFAEELGIDVQKNTPSPLFRLLVASHLLAANIDARLGLRAAEALSHAGWTTAEHLADATDDERYEVLTEARFLRKRRTAELLGRTARECVERWHGDLRRLREEADGDAGRCAELVADFSGIGEVGADVFLREVQVAWPEHHPYVGGRAGDGAAALGLPRTPERLAELVDDDPGTFCRLSCALVRSDMAGDAAELRAQARG